GLDLLLIVADWHFAAAVAFLDGLRRRPLRGADRNRSARNWLPLVRDRDRRVGDRPRQARPGQHDQRSDESSQFMHPAPCERKTSATRMPSPCNLARASDQDRRLHKSQISDTAKSGAAEFAIRV